MEYISFLFVEEAGCFFGREGVYLYSPVQRITTAEVCTAQPGVCRRR